MILLPQIIDCCDSFLRGFAQPATKVFFDGGKIAKITFINNFPDHIFKISLIKMGVKKKPFFVLFKIRGIPLFYCV
jgi:hypothetical protein